MVRDFHKNLWEFKREHTWLPKGRYGGLSFLPTSLEYNVISKCTGLHEISPLIARANHVYSNK